jgi:hypothetical protein
MNLWMSTNAEGAEQLHFRCPICLQDDYARSHIPVACAFTSSMTDSVSWLRAAARNSADSNEMRVPTRLHDPTCSAVLSATTHAFLILGNGGSSKWASGFIAASFLSLITRVQ